MEWRRTEIPGFDNGVSSKPSGHRDRFQARFGADWKPPVASPGLGATVGLSVGLGYYTVPVLGMLTVAVSAAARAGEIDLKAAGLTAPTTAESVYLGTRV